jgi:hypothetical protein
MASALDAASMVSGDGGHCSLVIPGDGVPKARRATCAESPGTDCTIAAMATNRAGRNLPSCRKAQPVGVRRQSRRWG